MAPRFDIDVVVLSNIPKELPSNVEVIVGLPAKDPWSLPFGHKRVFAERVSDYDMFIYSEDDTLITEGNIRAFLSTVEYLPGDEVAGFIRYELDNTGKRYYSTIHSHFHWVPKSVKTTGPYTFARFTNDHSACYMLTREQLQAAIESGGFLVEPHQEKYDLLVTAATDPYTQCGFTKVICVSHLENFCLHHLPNPYIGRMGISSADLQQQLDALMTITTGRRSPQVLFDGQTSLKQGRWSKRYFEDVRNDILSLVPSWAKNVLSIGCGRGVTEAVLVDRGAQVTGVPLDTVIGACSEARGIEIVAPDFGMALDELSGRYFNCILFIDVLQHLHDPVNILSRYARLLSPDGVILVSVPNMNHFKVWYDLLMQEFTWRQRWVFGESRLHFTTETMVKRWLKQGGIDVVKVVHGFDGRFCKFEDVAAGAFDCLLAPRLIFVGKKTER